MNVGHRRWIEWGSVESDATAVSWRYMASSPQNDFGFTIGGMYKFMPTYKAQGLQGITVRAVHDRVATEKGDRHPAREAFSGIGSGMKGREPVPFFLARGQSERKPL